MGMINNPDNIEIRERKIYNDIVEYTIPENYYFESCGTSYGNRIYGHIQLSNYYTIRKRDDSNIEKDSI